MSARWKQLAVNFCLGGWECRQLVVNRRLSVGCAGQVRGEC